MAYKAAQERAQHYLMQRYADCTVCFSVAQHHRYAPLSTPVMGLPAFLLRKYATNVPDAKYE